MERSGEMAKKKAILDMMDFGCASCAYTVERMGKKIAGVEAIRVDLSKHEIRVDYDGDDTVLDEICSIVNRIGHDAKVRE
jgi:copper chaperone CopZ